MGDTSISWTHRPGTRARTWNPTRGCALLSEGCRHCYAMRMARRFAGPGGVFEGLVNLKTGKWTGETRMATHKLSEPLSWQEPSTVFVDSMSDLFYEGFTNEEIAAVFGVMAACPQHTFMILTKRARRMREWFEWLDKSITRYWHGQHGVLFEHLQAHLGEAATDAAWQRAIALDPPPTSLGDTAAHRWPLSNVWLGVSVENQDAADERIPELLATPAAVRFLSCEPLLGPADVRCPRCHGTGQRFVEGHSFNPALGRPLALIRCDCSERDQAAIDWVIAGCESGPGARPCEVEWLRSLRDQCKKAAGVAFFLKQAVEGGGSGCAITYGPGSHRKAGGVIELPYLDGVQHAEFPQVST